MSTTLQPETGTPIRPGEASGPYRFPPGLSRNLPFYLFSRFFKPGNPILLFEYLRENYGNVSHYKLGNQHIVFLNDPELIREVLVNQAPAFIKERTQRRMKILLGEGLITSEGEFHMRQRRIAAPAFHRQRISAYAGVMTDRAAAMRQRWKPTESFDIAAAMMTLSLEIVSRTLFDTDVTDDIRQINTEVNAIMALYNFLVALPAAESYLHWPIPGLMRFRRARKRLDAVVNRMIASRRAESTDAPDSSEEKSDRGDLLSMLISSRDDEADHTGMNAAQLRDEVITIFLAGYETVANALTWTWYLLSQNPAAESRMHAEIDSVLGTGPSQRLPTLADLPNLRYTEMVFAESMRLYPPAWAMGRQATRPITLGEWHFPAQTYFFFSQYILQRTEQYFPDPLRFDPLRFTPEQKAARPRFAYFPFGGGGRQCIGEAFAWMEASLVLATIVQHWELRPSTPNQQLSIKAAITLRPKNGLPLELHRRSR